MSVKCPALWILLSALSVGVAGAQETGPPILLEGVEQLDFDRPESWAMKYFASVALPTGLGAPLALEAGTVSVELEAGLVPNLGEEKRRVGFIGSKAEDLNRSNLFARVRTTIGLPRGVALTLGATPPVTVDGVKPKLVSAGVAFPVRTGARWRLGARLHGQSGTLAGDLTCPRAVAGSADPVLNPDDCREPSNDEMSLDSVGLEASIGRTVGENRWLPYLTVSLQHFDLAFQVRARYSAFLDRVRLETSGVTYSAAAGVEVLLQDSLRVSGEILYTPLEVVRSPLRGRQVDELVNVRVLMRYRLR